MVHVFHQQTKKKEKGKETHTKVHAFQRVNNQKKRRKKKKQEHMYKKYTHSGDSGVSSKKRKETHIQKVHVLSSENRKKEEHTYLLYIFPSVAIFLTYLL